MKQFLGLAFVLLTACGEGGSSLPAHTVTESALPTRSGLRVQVNVADDITEEQCFALIDAYRSKGEPDGQVSVHQPFVIFSGDMAPACHENFDGKGPQLNDYSGLYSAMKAEVWSLGGTHNYAMILPEGYEPHLFTIMAQLQCSDAQACHVHGWLNRQDAPAKLPFTDAEVESQVFSYYINQVTDSERSLWNCRVFKRDDPNECLAR